MAEMPRVDALPDRAYLAEMPVLEVGDVVWIKADAAKYTVLSDLHGRWLSEDVDEIFRDGVTIWRKGATINDPR